MVVVGEEVDGRLNCSDGHAHGRGKRQTSCRRKRKNARGTSQGVPYVETIRDSLLKSNQTSLCDDDENERRGWCQGVNEV